jgi:hypothetical protein
MRQFFAAVAAVVEAMATTATRWVRRAGTWVLEHITPASPSIPALPPELSASASPDDDFAAMRRVAGILAQDRVPEPGDMAGLADDHLQWLRVLDRRALCRVLAADDKVLRAHIRGTAVMKGMPHAERDAVAALLRARERYDYEGEVEEERSLAWAPAL